MIIGAELATADELAVDEGFDEFAAALLCAEIEELLAASTLLTADDRTAVFATDEITLLLAADEMDELLAATDEGVGEGAVVESPPLPPPQLERKPKTDKLIIAVLTRIKTPFYFLIASP